MQPKAAVRSSWNDPEPVFVFQGSPPHSDATSAERQAPPAAPPGRHARQGGSRPALRVRRPGSVPAPATAAAEAPPLPAQPPAQPAPPAQAPAAVPFAFGTPGAGASGSAAKVRRARARTPAAAAAAAAAPSPAFTTGSSASMAWSPYPASSSADASTAFGGATTPEVPGSATPTSGHAPPSAEQTATPSPGPASVAEDLRSRLSLGGTDSGASSSGGEQGLSEALRQQLNLGVQQAAVPAAAAAQPQPAPSADPQSARSGFSFIFGAAAAAAAAAFSPRAGRAIRKKSPTTSPGAARTPAAASSAGAAAAAAPGMQAQAAPGAASFPSAADCEATSAARPAPGAEPAAGGGSAPVVAAPPAGSFAFGASSGSSGTPAAGRARPRSRHKQRSPSQASPVAAATPGAAASPVHSGSTAGTATGPEPLRENQQQQQQQHMAWAARMAEAGKPTAGAAATSPSFSASGAAARRPPRRKVVHPTRVSPGGKAAASKQPAGQATAAAPAAAPAASFPPASPPPAAVPASPRQPGAAWDAATQAAYSSSEMYRSQGNEAFRDGDYNAAYDLYTKALHALWPHPPLHARLALLLSNRAAALLSQGKPLSALADCQMGLKYDPGLMRCALRVATCHARCGDFDQAFACVAALHEGAQGDAERLAEVAAKRKDLAEQERQMYDALRSLGHSLLAPQRDPSTGAVLQRSASAGTGLSRASSSSSAAAAAPANAEAFWDALKKVDDVAPHVPHSELLLAAKAEGLLRLGRLEKAREFCEQPLHMDDGPHQEEQNGAPWRLWVQVQCSWQEGDTGGGLKQQLERLLTSLERQAAAQGSSSGAAAAAGAAAASAATSAFFPAPTSSAEQPASKQEQRRREQLAGLVGLPSAADVKALLEGLEAADGLRLAGNAAVKAGKAAEAVQKYSEALAVGCLSPTIAAVLLSNRAAAHQHLKQRAQAVADCSRAVALNPHYAKANSRLATLLAELGYHDDAAAALEAAAAAKGVSSGDKREYQQRLATEKAAARRAASRSGRLSTQPALDHYKLLGLERSVATEEVRRSYKKLALQLHPDKAATVCRVVQRCCGCGSLAFESAAAPGRLQERATWLFKLLGEASEVLSDPGKRRDLDHSLSMFGGAASSHPYGAGGFGSYSSFYQDDDDDEQLFSSYFGGVFGRRYAPGYGPSGAPYGGFASGSTGPRPYGGFGGYTRKWNM